MNLFFGRGVGMLVAMGSILLSTACGSYPTLPDIAAEINATLEPGPLRLTSGDSIEVKFPHPSDAAWDHTVIVRRDGRASFLFIDEISVVGMTIEALDRVLTKAYQDRAIMADPELTVNLTDIAVRNAVVMGEVNQPGAVPIEGGRLSFIEAIGLAGGPIKETALLEEVILVRWMPTEGRQRVWRINAAADYWLSGNLLMLQAHDVIFIPNTGIDNVDIWVDQYIRQMIPIPGILPIN